MTLGQLFAWNGKIPLQEYEDLLKQIEAKEKALRRAQDVIYDEEASLDILKDEQGSERWQRHEKRYLAALKRAEKLTKEIKSLKLFLE